MKFVGCSDLQSVKSVVWVVNRVGKVVVYGNVAGSALAGKYI